MATLSDQTSRITLNVLVSGTSATKANRSFNYVNPVISDDQALYVANKLGGFTLDTVNYVQRTNSYKIAAS